MFGGSGIISDRKKAKAEWHRLESEPEPVIVEASKDVFTVWEVLDEFLEHGCKEVASTTFQWYKERLQYFKDGVENMPFQVAFITGSSRDIDEP
jgi:hypothetical protein